MQDYKDAMKSADVLKKNTVNMVRAAIKQYEVDQRVTLEDDADIVKIIKKQVKMRADALEDFAKAGRDDMVEGYKKEIEILKSYLPEEMGEEEIRAKVREIAEKLGVEANMKNMGMLMKSVMAFLAALVRMPARGWLAERACTRQSSERGFSLTSASSMVRGWKSAIPPPFGTEAMKLRRPQSGLRACRTRDLSPIFVVFKMMSRVWWSISTA